MKRTNVITEGAILLAIFNVFLLGSLYLPIIGMIFFFLLSTPFIIFTIRHGMKKATLFFVISQLLALLFGSLIALPTAFMFGVSGIVIGSIMQKKKSRYAVLAGGSLSFLVTILIQYMGAVLFFNINFIEEFKKILNESIEMSSSVLSAIGQSSSDQMIEQFRQAVDMFTYLIPSLLVAIAFLFALFTLLFATPIVKRLGMQVDPWPPFRELVFPKSLLWYYLIIMFLRLLQFEEGTFMYTAVINLFFILQWIIVIQGISFVFFYSHHKEVSRGIPLIVTITSFFIPFLLYIIQILGIMDLGFNLRKKAKNK